MIVTNEHVFNNPKLGELADIIKDTRLEFVKNYGKNYCRRNEVRCNVKCFNRIQNKTKNITIKHYFVHYGKRKTIIASQGSYGIFEPNKLIILLEGIIYKSIIITHMKCNNIPTLGRKFFLKIANNRDYVYNICNSPYNSFHQHCRECYFHNLMKNNTDID